MYFICKFSDSWSIYDADHGTSRPLDQSEVTTLSALFPGLLKDNTKILTAVQISTIAPNKLMQLPMPQKPVSTRKLPEITTATGLTNDKKNN